MNLNQINPLVMAYIGDAIYEVKMREKLIKKGINKVNELQKECTKYVSAKGQSNIIMQFIQNNILTEDELEIYKRGRNTKTNSHPSNTNIVIYKQATGFETLFGYLYLNDDTNRIDELISHIMEE